MSASNRWWRDYDAECDAWDIERDRRLGVRNLVGPNGWISYGRPITITIKGGRIESVRRD